MAVQNGLLVGVVAFIFACAGANAQTTNAKAANATAPGSETLSVESLNTEKPKDDKPQDEADQVLTNKRLRAATGSLSTWSVMSSLSYSAGSVEKPLDPIRPNITRGNADMPSLQSLGGSIGIKYRSSKMSALNFNGGLRTMSPFQSQYQSDNPKNQATWDKQHGKFDLFDPSMSYMHIFKALGGQNYVVMGQTYITSSNYRQVGYISATNLSHSIAYEVGQTRATLGTSTNFSYNYFDNNDPALRSAQTEYQFGFYPFAEYAINDTFHLRTLVGFGFEHNRDRSAATLTQLKVYQSVGLGISVIRDVYLYPNIQFLPDEIRADKTNVALTTNINIF